MRQRHRLSAGLLRLDAAAFEAKAWANMTPESEISGATSIRLGRTRLVPRLEWLLPTRYAKDREIPLPIRQEINPRVSQPEPMS